MKKCKKVDNGIMFMNNNTEVAPTPQQQKQLVVPMVTRYGVNLVTGEPHTPDLFNAVIDIIEETPCCESAPMGDIGERREALSAIFESRAKTLLFNTTRNFNMNMFNAIDNSKFKRLHQAVIVHGSWGDDERSGVRYEFINTRCLLADNSYGYGSKNTVANTEIPYVHSPAKLTDLRYYMNISIEEVLNVMLSAIMTEYGHILTRLDSVVINAKGEYDDLYADYRDIISGKFIEFISMAEAAVMLLATEVEKVFHPASYPGCDSMPYHKIQSFAEMSYNIDKYNEIVEALSAVHHEK